jgi:N6-L-threonylcarbamoyladenine synthase
MKILSIETSCDETSIASVEASGGIRAPRFKVLQNIVSSQIALHAPFGGVVPNIAKREHLKNLPIIFRQIFVNPKSKILNPKQTQNTEYKILSTKVDVVAVTVGPGLEPALWTGVNFAKEIHKNHFPKAKLIGVNHMEGHLYSFLLPQKTQFPISNSQFSKTKIFPAVGLVVSGGHTILLLMKSLTEWKKLGETRDDAVGEAFDKVARMLGLPYPGGPEIQRAAAPGDPSSVNFPRPMMKDKNYDFSFSGLKTSVLYYIRDHKEQSKNKNFIEDVAASFQAAAVETLVYKTARAVQEFKAKSIILAGGVAANQSLRETLVKTSKELGVHFFAPPMAYNTDNAAMIAAAAYIQTLKKKNRRITAQANLNL